MPMQSAVSPQAIQGLTTIGQQNLQSRQIAEQSAASMRASEVQREGIASASNTAAQQTAAGLAKATTEAHSQAQYRDLMAKRSATEADIARAHELGVSERHTEELDLRKQLAERQFGMERSRIKLKMDLHLADASEQEQLREALGSLANQRTALSRRQFEAQQIQSGSKRDFNEVLLNNIGKLDTHLDRLRQGTSTAIPQINDGLSEGRYITTETFGIDQGKVSQIRQFVESMASWVPSWFSDSDALDQNTKAMLMSLGTNPLFRSGFDTAEYGEELGGMGDYTGTVLPFSLAKLDPVKAMEERIAEVVTKNLDLSEEADGTGGRGFVAAAITRALKSSRNVTDEEKLLAIRADYNKQLQAAGVDPMTVDELLITAQKKLYTKAHAYGMLAMPKNFNMLDNVLEEIQVGGTAENPTGWPMQKAQAWIASQLYSHETIDGLNRFTASGTSLDEYQTFRDQLAGEGLSLANYEKLFEQGDELGDLSGGPMDTMFEDPQLLSLLSGLQSGETGLADIERDMQRFTLHDEPSQQNLMGLTSGAFGNRARADAYLEYQKTLQGIQ